MPNEQEAMALTDEPDAARAARRLRELGASTVILKRGEHGCLIADDDGEREIPGFEAPVVDTTGCGDAFCAAVIVATLRRRVNRRGRPRSATPPARSTCAASAPTPARASLDELRDFMGSGVA